MLAVVLLAFAVSIDGMGVGLAYGLGRVRLPWTSLLLMGIASGGAVLVSMSLGNVVGRLLSAGIAEFIGGGILIAFGLWMLWQTRAKQRKGLLGLVDDPAQADQDSSGSISAQEATVLGIALALDAFGAGFGAALAGFPPLATGAAVAVAKVLLVSTGLRLGNLVSQSGVVKLLKWMPGLIICALGILKIIL